MNSSENFNDRKDKTFQFFNFYKVYFLTFLPYVDGRYIKVYIIINIFFVSCYTLNINMMCVLLSYFKLCNKNGEMFFIRKPFFLKR